MKSQWFWGGNCDGCVGRGCFAFADLFVADCLIVEIKAVRHILDELTAQLLGYLRSSKIEHGLLINFGGPKFAIRKYFLSEAIEEDSETVL